MPEESRNVTGRVWFWLVVAAAVLFLVLFLYSETFNSFINAITVWAKGIIERNPVAGAVVFFLFSALSAMLAFASTAVLVPPANLVWGKLVTFVLLWSGWILGAMIAYGIGRVARPLLVRLGYKKKLDQYKEFISRRMKFWLVLMFCLAVPSEIPGYVFGSAHYPFWKFILAIALAEGVFAAGLVLAGESLVTARPVTLVVIIAALLVIVASAGYLFRVLRKRKASRS